MAIILNYGDKTKMDTSGALSMKIQDPMLSKDPTHGSKLVYQLVKNSESLSNETLDMITSKFKMTYVRPTKPYILKL